MSGTPVGGPGLLWAAVPPAVVVLPAQPLAEGDTEAQVVLREVAGRLLVLAYTSPDALARCCGDDQPWVAMTAPDVEAVRVAAGADGVVLNVVLA